MPLMRGILSSLLLANMPFLGQKHPAAHHLEQNSFSVERPFAKQVPLPTPVFELLKQDRNAVEASVVCTDKGGGPDVLRPSWFRASEIHLAVDDEIDLVILASNNCLNGAHGGPFWVVRKTNKNYRIVLSTGGDGLKVLSSRSNGLRDILVGTFTADSSSEATYKFDGETYEVSDTKVNSK